MALIGLISDVHAAAGPVAEALEIFRQAKVDQVWCAGDMAGYMDELPATIELLREHCDQSIIGNHDLSYLDKTQSDMTDSSIEYLRHLGSSYEAVIDGKSLYMVHAQPPDGCHGGIKLLDRTGELIPSKIEYWQTQLKSFEHDVLIVGHTHQVYVEQIAGVLVINPGSTVFNHSCAILRLPEMTVELFALSGKKIQQTWNWGEHVIYGNS